MSVLEQPRSYPSPNRTLTLACYRLTVVVLRDGWVSSCLVTDIDPGNRSK